MTDLQPDAYPDLEADLMGRFQLTLSYFFGHPRLAEALQAVAGEALLDTDLVDVLAVHGITLPPGSTFRFVAQEGATPEDDVSDLFSVCVIVGARVVCVEFNSPISIQ